MNTQKFNNSKNSALAKNSTNHTYFACYNTAKEAREICAKTSNVFYKTVTKKIRGQKYTQYYVYSF